MESKIRIPVASLVLFDGKVKCSLSLLSWTVFLAPHSANMDLFLAGRDRNALLPLFTMSPCPMVKMCWFSTKPPLTTLQQRGKCTLLRRMEVEFQALFMVCADKKSGKLLYSAVIEVPCPSWIFADTITEGVETGASLCSC